MISCNNIPSVNSVWVLIHEKGLFRNIYLKDKRLTKEPFSFSHS